MANNRERRFSVESYWSLQGLPDDHPQRRVTRSQAAATVDQAPDIIRRRWRYPKEFSNDEKLPLQSPNNTLEFPLLNHTQWRPGLDADVVRTIYSPEKDTDRIDVGYHDPRRGQNNKENMNLGVYHSRSRQRAQNVQPEEHESRLENSGSSSISEESENDGGSQGEKKEGSVSHPYPLYPQHRANPFAEQ